MASGEKSLELRVASAAGIPPGSLVSIRVGAVRRQAPYGSDRPYRFQGIGSRTEAMKVDVYAPIAHARLLIETCETKSWKQPLEPPSNYEGPQAALLNGGEEMSINFEILGGDGSKEDSKRILAEAGGYEPIIDATPLQGPSNPSNPSAAPSRPQSAVKESSAKRHQVALEAQPYFEQHEILEVMQKLLQALIKEKPTDPYEYMVQVLQNSQRAAAYPDRRSRPQSAPGGGRPQRPQTAKGSRQVAPWPPAGAPTQPPPPDGNYTENPQQAVGRPPIAPLAPGPNAASPNTPPGPLGGPPAGPPGVAPPSSAAPPPPPAVAAPPSAAPPFGLPSPLQSGSPRPADVPSQPPPQDGMSTANPQSASSTPVAAQTPSPPPAPSASPQTPSPPPAPSASPVAPPGAPQAHRPKVRAPQATPPGDPGDAQPLDAPLAPPSAAPEASFPASAPVAPMVSATPMRPLAPLPPGVQSSLPVASATPVPPSSSQPPAGPAHFLARAASLPKPDPPPAAPVPAAPAPAAPAPADRAPAASAPADPAPAASAPAAPAPAAPEPAAPEALTREAMASLVNASTSGELAGVLSDLKQSNDAPDTGEALPKAAPAEPEPPSNAEEDERAKSLKELSGLQSIRVEPEEPSNAEPGAPSNPEEAAPPVGTAAADPIDVNDLPGRRQEDETVTTINFKFENLDYDKVISSPKLAESLKNEVAEGIASSVGVPKSSVEVELSKGSVVVNARILCQDVDAAGQIKKQADHRVHAVLDNVEKGVTNIPEVKEALVDPAAGLGTMLGYIDMSKKAPAPPAAPPAAPSPQASKTAEAFLARSKEAEAREKEMQAEEQKRNAILAAEEQEREKERTEEQKRRAALAAEAAEARLKSSQEASEPVAANTQEAAANTQEASAEVAQTDQEHGSAEHVDRIRSDIRDGLKTAASQGRLDEIFAAVGFGPSSFGSQPSQAAQTLSTPEAPESIAAPLPAAPAPAAVAPETPAAPLPAAPAPAAVAPEPPAAPPPAAPAPPAAPPPMMPQMEPISAPARMPADLSEEDIKQLRTRIRDALAEKAEKGELAALLSKCGFGQPPSSAAPFSDEAVLNALPPASRAEVEAADGAAAAPASVASTTYDEECARLRLSLRQALADKASKGELPALLAKCGFGPAPADQAEGPANSQAAPAPAPPAASASPAPAPPDPSAPPADPPAPAAPAPAPADPAEAPADPQAMRTIEGAAPAPAPAPADPAEAPISPPIVQDASAAAPADLQQPAYPKPDIEASLYADVLLVGDEDRQCESEAAHEVSAKAADEVQEQVFRQDFAEMPSKAEGLRVSLRDGLLDKYERGQLDDIFGQVIEDALSTTQTAEASQAAAAQPAASSQAQAPAEPAPAAKAMESLLQASTSGALAGALSDLKQSSDAADTVEAPPKALEQSPPAVAPTTSSAEPAGAPTTTPAPVAEPAVEPTIAAAVEPAVAPTTAPVAEPAVEPTTAAAVEPAVAPTTTPAEPATAPTTTPAPVAEPVVEPTAAVDPAVAPTTTPAAEPPQDDIDTVRRALCAKFLEKANAGTLGALLQGVLEASTDPANVSPEEAEELEKLRLRLKASLAEAIEKNQLPDMLDKAWELVSDKQLAAAVQAAESEAPAAAEPSSSQPPSQVPAASAPAEPVESVAAAPKEEQSADIDDLKTKAQAQVLQAVNNKEIGALVQEVLTMEVGQAEPVPTDAVPEELTRSVATPTVAADQAAPAEPDPPSNAEEDERAKLLKELGGLQSIRVEPEEPSNAEPGAPSNPEEAERAELLRDIDGLQVGGSSSSSRPPPPEKKKSWGSEVGRLKECTSKLDERTQKLEEDVARLAAENQKLREALKKSITDGKLDVQAALEALL